MAKNLKLNIKNAQLAKALNLTKVKKPVEEKKKPEEARKPEEEIKVPPQIVSEPPAVIEKPAPEPVEEVIPPPPPEVVPPVVEKVEPPVAKTEYVKKEEPVVKRSSPLPPYTRTPRPGEVRPADTRPSFTRPGAMRPGYVRPGTERSSTDRPGFERKPFAKELPSEKTPPVQLEKKPEKFVGFKEFKDVKPQKKSPQTDSFDSRDRQGLRDNEQQDRWRKQKKSKMRSYTEEQVIRPKSLKVRLPITVKDLAQEMKLKASELIGKLFLQGVALTLNDLLDDETTVQLLGHEFECEITIDTSEERRLRITDKTIKEEIASTPKEQIKLRPPLITFMGHVDHGKTSLIDSIRSTNLTDDEAGSITQHIGAFRCHTAVGDITILDTPGHEAFFAMRTRGADITDIVVLVVAGDEGIKEQTVEAINQAKEAKVPILVAINKCDKPNYNVENVYRELSERELLPEAWGGSTITVNCSAVTGQGIKELLEMLALQAEILELQANPNSRARGTVIESQLHKGLGAVCTVLVQNGTLKLGDAVVFAEHWGRIKTMHDEHNRELKTAGPSSPVKITGLSGLPEAGSEFIVVSSEREARELSEKRVEGNLQKIASQSKRVGFESLMQKKAEKKKVLNLVLRADVQGSLEALQTSLMKIKSSKVEVNILSSDIGEISESDIELAFASKATVLGFHTKIQPHADSLIKQTHVPVRLHNIIYHAVDDVKALMKELLDKIPEETDTGSAFVKAVFKSSHLGVIAGCQVAEGTIKRNHLIRQIREGEVIWKGKMASLKRAKEDVKEVTKGIECGILLQNHSDVKVDDILQAYEITYHEQDL